MLKYDPIHRPAHYVANRKIQPIDVIEQWQLCHHLACVVKYIARYGRKTNPFQDLRKAKWYLERELDSYAHGFSKCQIHFATIKLTPEEIAIDWELSPELYRALAHLRNAQNKSFPATSIWAALQSLRAQMELHEKV